MIERDIAIVPDVRTAEENEAAAHDLAWTHASALSALHEHVVGDDEFIGHYQDLLERYKVCTTCMGFLQNSALRVTRELMQAGMALMVPKDATDDDMIAAIQDIAHVIISHEMWLFASFPEDWMTNEEWEDMPLEARAVTFPINATPRTLSRENNDHHD